MGLDAVSSSARKATGVAGKSPGDVVGPMLEATKRFAAAHPGLQVGQVEPGSIDSEVGRQLDADFQRAEIVSLPVTLGVLLVAFGAVVAAGVPVLLGIGAVMTALGLTALVSRNVTPVDQNTQSLVLLIGLAVGIRLPRSSCCAAPARNGLRARPSARPSRAQGPPRAERSSSRASPWSWP